MNKTRVPPDLVFLENTRGWRFVFLRRSVGVHTLSCNPRADLQTHARPSDSTATSFVDFERKEHTATR